MVLGGRILEGKEENRQQQMQQQKWSNYKFAGCRSNNELTIFDP